METLETLYSRKSIREFNGESITQDELKEILKSAYASPIGLKRYDRLTLTVITKKELIREWEEETARVMDREGYKAFYGAPLVILVCSEVDGEPYSNVNYSNAAIVAHNMAIAATALGIGVCHIWSAPRALRDLVELQNKMGIKENHIPCCAVALGRMDEVYSVREIEWEKIATSYSID
ncbi:MAG: nitroreductase family protein [Clostridia bacterium]|nr:nitroreductase family protein [Clostridia bacterium]